MTVSSAAIRYIAFGPHASPAQVAFYERMLVNTPPGVRADIGIAMSEMDLHDALPRLTVTTIVTDQSRHQSFESFGYPGGTERMRTCVSGFAGEDPITFGLAGPSTVSIRCRWAPGASGGGWMIEGGTEIDGINTYLRVNEKQRTFGPYFATETVGRLVEGL